jgi:CBS domain containing-hemolysin-like protein
MHRTLGDEPLLKADSMHTDNQDDLGGDSLNAPTNSDISSSRQPEADGKSKKNKFISFINKKLFRRNDSDIREALAGYIDENENEGELDQVARHERVLISNVLKLHDLTVYDVMVPRAEITAIDVESSYQQIINLILEKQHSRIPIYRDKLDNVIGFVHLKDLLNKNHGQGAFDLSAIIRDLPILSPSLPVLDLLMQMKQTKRHMAVVIDEYGGIDGLVTIEDLTEAIVGEIDDEFDEEDEPSLVIKPEDGTIIADARIAIEDLEREVDIYFGTEEELDDIDTLGGYITNKIGRVPARGEVLRDQQNSVIFEIIDADPRRINRVRIRKLAP